MDEPPPSNSDSASTYSIQSLLQLLKDSIWKKRPILGEIMKKHGHKTLFNYAMEFADVNPTPQFDDRKTELIKTATDLISKRLGVEIAVDAMRQLKRLPLVSTADHHGPIDHPFWVNANIITSLFHLDNPKHIMQYLVVFSFASISMNNASAFPRGLLFHSEPNGAGKLIRLPLLPDKLKMGVVYNSRGIIKSDIDNAVNQLDKLTKSNEINPEIAKKVKELMEEYVNVEEILELPDLNTQITRLNFRLWHDTFHKTGGLPTDRHNKMLDLIYLDIETLTKELLVKFHLNNNQSLIYRLLFNPDFIKLAKTHFNNIPGAFSIEEDWGTWFFWGLDEKMRRVRLFTDGQKLYSPDKSISINFEPSSLIEALEKKVIYPSMMTCYLIVALYYGMKCLGGFCQVHDLTMLKYAWFKMLNKLGFKEEAEAILPIQTKELGGDGMVLSYCKRPDNKFVPATGIDMLLDDSDTSPNQYVELSRRVSLNDIMNPMLPEIYTVLYPFDKRDPKLANLTPEDILEATGLGEKIIQKTEVRVHPTSKISVKISKPESHQSHAKTI